jgi:hypothetical protein
MAGIEVTEEENSGRFLAQRRMTSFVDFSLIGKSDP